MSDRYTDYDSSYYDRELRRREFSRYVKRKKRRAIAALLGLMFSAAVVVVGLAFGIKIAVDGGFSRDKSPYVNDIPGVSLSLVNNVFSAMEDTAEVDASEVEVDETGLILSNPIVPVYENGLIIIDAGHGGYDPGALSPYVEEKALTLEIAMWLKEELENRGYSIYMTRTDDTFVGINKRATLANEQKDALAFISVHINSIENAPQVAGIEAHTYERDGCGLLGDLLCMHVSEQTGASNRGRFYRSNLVVTSKTTMPAAIIECGYITNEAEVQNLMQQEYQLKIVKGIADAVDEFVTEYYK